MEKEIAQLPAKAKQVQKENQRLLKYLKKKKPKDLDSQVQALDEEAFDHIDCLECANCCRTTSPLFKTKDIERLAKHLKMKPGEFIEQYLEIDEDGDYAFPEAPCPFLMSDNYCMVYEYRPNACREFPHTNRRKFHQVIGVTSKNIAICPAVFEIVEKLRTVYEGKF